MKIGIISDTHDNLTKIKEAVNILNDKKVEFVFHCGDFIAPFSLEYLEKLNCDWLGVFGNNDGERDGLAKRSKGKIKEAPYLGEFFSKKIAITHIYKELDADVVLFGHTHKVEIKKERQLVINPGEVSGWLYGKSSLVLLDLDKLEPEVLYF
jgi:hypothetical protein